MKIIGNFHSNKNEWKFPLIQQCLLLDTVPGRQCMASCFMLLKQFEDVLVYFNSIKVKKNGTKNNEKTGVGNPRIILHKTKTFTVKSINCTVLAL